MSDEKRHNGANEVGESVPTKNRGMRFRSFFSRFRRAPKTDRPRGSRARRVVSQIGLFVAGVLAVLLLVVLVLQTGWGANRVRQIVEGRVSSLLKEARLEIGDLGGNLVSSLELADIRLLRDDGSVLAQIDSITAGYRLIPLLFGRLDVRYLTIVRPDVEMRQRPDSTWDLISAFPDSGNSDSASESGGMGMDISVGKLSLKGAIVKAYFYTSKRDSLFHLSEAELLFSNFRMDETLVLDLDTLRARFQSPLTGGIVDVALGGSLSSGRLSITGMRLHSEKSSVIGSGSIIIPGLADDPDREAKKTGRFNLVADPLSFSDIHMFAPSLNPSTTIDTRLEIDADGRRLRARGDANFSSGGSLDLDAEMLLSRTDSLLYRATADIRQLNTDAFVGLGSLAQIIDANVRIDVSGTALDRMDGMLTLSATRGIPSQGFSDHASVSGSFEDGRLELELSAEWKRASVSGGGFLRPFDDVPSYDVDVKLGHVNPESFLQKTSMKGDINASLSIAGTGFNVESADTRIEVQLQPSSFQNLSIDGARLTASLTNGLVALHSKIETLSGTIEVDGNAETKEEISFAVDRGHFSNLNVAALSEDTTSSSLNGSFTIRGTVADAETLTLEADVTMEESFYGTYSILGMQLSGRMEEESFNLDLNGQLTDGATIEGHARIRPLEDGLPFTLERASFHGLNLGSLLQNESVTTDLNGEVTAEGRSGSTDGWRMTAEIQLLPSTINTQRIETGRASIDYDQGVARFVTRLGWAGGGVNFSGSVNPTLDPPTFALDNGSFENINAGAFLGSGRVDTQITGTISADGAGFDPSTMVLDAQIELAPSRINGSEVESAGASLRVLNGRSDAELSARIGQGNIQATGWGRFLDDDVAFGLSGSIDEVDGAALVGLDSLDSSLNMTFAFSGSGLDPESMTLDGTGRMQASHFDTARVDSLKIRFNLADGVLTTREMVMRSNFLNATGSGRIALFDTTNTATSNFLLAGSIVGLEPVRTWIDVSTLSLETGSVTAAVRGTADALNLDLGISGSSFIFDQLHVSDLNFRTTASLDEFREVRTATGKIEIELITLPEFDVELTVIDVDYDGEVFEFDGDIRFDPRRSGGFSGRLERFDDEQELTLDSASLTLDEDEWTLRSSSTLRIGERYVLGNTVLSSPGQQLILAGALDPHGQQSAFFRATNVRIGPLAEWMGFDRLGGTLNSSLVLTGSAEAPRLAGTVGFDILSSGNRVGDVSISLLYDSLRVKVDAAIDDRNGSTMSILGYVPVDLRLATPEGERMASGEEIVFQIDAEASSLTWIRPFIDRNLADVRQGTLTVDANVSGTLEEPVLGGTIQIQDAAIHFPEFGKTYEHIVLKSTMQNNEMVIESARMRSGEGTLSATGTIEFASLLNSSFNLDITAADFRAIENETYRATVSGNFLLSGRTVEPRLEGEMQLTNTDIILSDYTGGDIEQVSLGIEDQRMLEDIFGYRVSETDTLSLDFYRAMEMDLSVRLERDTWIRQRANPKMSVELTGRLDIQKESQSEDLLLFRSISVVPQRSYIEQFGRRFDITEGTVTFNGPVQEMIMDIKAQYEVLSRLNPGEPEATITLGLSGRIDDLRLELGSDPVMDNTDIVSYIATGRPASQSLQFGGMDQSGGVLGLAAGQLAGVIEGVAGENLGLDVIEIQQDGLKGTQLTAGKYLSGRTYVGISQPISFGGQGTSQVNETREVTLEFKVFEWLLLQLMGETNTSAVRLNLTGRYAF